jgi:hypothetical protein
LGWLASLRSEGGEVPIFDCQSLDKFTPIRTPADFSSSTALSAPVSIVPPALNSVTASSVTAPNSLIPGSIPSASGVTPPNSGVPSSVPSSSGVTPPGSSPGTATGVTPPSGGGNGVVS